MYLGGFVITILTKPMLASEPVIEKMIEFAEVTLIFAPTGEAHSITFSKGSGVMRQIWSAG